MILVALYLVLPELAGLADSLRKIEDADPVWMAIALGFNLLSFAAYIALFRGILGGRRRHAAGTRAARLAHARTRSRSPGWRPRACSRRVVPGGIALTYWALRRAGMGAA